MRPQVEIENIEELRRSAGIDDAELHEEIQTLQAGDQVRLTFLAIGKAQTSATVVVRIVSIQGEVFHGKVEKRPAGTETAGLKICSTVHFSKDQIHSVVRRKSGQAPTSDRGGRPQASTRRKSGSSGSS